MSLIDAILHIPAGTVIAACACTPPIHKGNAALTYARLTPQQALAIAELPGVTVLAQAPYAGAATPDLVYTALFADPAMRALYDAVYDSSPREEEVEGGGWILVVPPERFGLLA